MSLTFPLGRGSFMAKLNRRIASARFDVNPQRQVTGLQGGDILSAEVAPTLWEGSIRLGSLDQYQASEIIPMLQALDAPGASFLAYDPQRAGPLMDATGAALSGSSPVIQSYGASANSIVLTGLPLGYVISPGDLVSWTYAGRYALHRFLEGSTAGGTGTTGSLQVTPHIRGAIAANAPATLVKAYCKAVIVPGSVNYGEKHAGRLNGVSFSFRQTLR